ncbi:pseudouridine synthase [Alishewanella tabrizica]|uniref:Pseudouridine synthase n=1 Tax=Alishewanella tabrizica TaxID=671278 RepID=A0ABQ2WJ19_9ALTE|nr:pseudouridine synthase [Alishewanella tabrizica]GGW59034.1 pseudouridine synthase [Alishewanella tabrizica]
MTTSLRLAKVIAQSGLCSRKAADRLISSGLVTVNGIVAQHHHTLLATDNIAIDGTELAAAPAKQYWLYHKPVGVDCNNRLADPASIAQLLTTLPVRLFAVGRLDKDSRGLLLLTNDGDVAQRLLHPDHAHQKCYRVTVDKPIDNNASVAFSQGIRWQVGPHQYVAKPCIARQISSNQLDITLTEGQHRQIRYMCRALGYKVLDLCRVAIGNLSLGELAAGACRQLTDAELTALLTVQPPEPTT